MCGKISCVHFADAWQGPVSFFDVEQWPGLLQSLHSRDPIGKQKNIHVASGGQGAKQQQVQKGIKTSSITQCPIQHCKFIKGCPPAPWNQICNSGRKLDDDYRWISLHWSALWKEKYMLKFLNLRLLPM